MIKTITADGKKHTDENNINNRSNKSTQNSLLVTAHPIQGHRGVGVGADCQRADTQAPFTLPVQGGYIVALGSCVVLYVRYDHGKGDRVVSPLSQEQR